MKRPEKPSPRLTNSEIQNPQAIAGLLPLIYEELRNLADRLLKKERQDHTLQPTALVNEVFLKLFGRQDITLANRAHFFALAARTMRQVLVDSARRHKAAKRGGGRHVLSIEEVSTIFEQQEVDVVELDEAMKRLSEVDERQCQVVELRFFGGLTIDETAVVLEISPATVKREWTMAKAWLHRELNLAR